MWSRINYIDIILCSGAQQQQNRGEEFMMSGLQHTAPPKVSVCEVTPTGHTSNYSSSQYSDLPSGRPMSGEYDHFDV